MVSVGEKMLVKAELLFTRKCNLACNGCAMPKEIDELSIEGWYEVVAKLVAWDVQFIAIYGAEPFMELEKLVLLIKYLVKLNVPHTVITNATFPEKDFLLLKQAGLKSISISQNIIDYGVGYEQKSKSAREKLVFLVKNFKDVQTILTLTSDDISKAPLFIKHQGEDYPTVWVGFDFLQVSAGKDDSKCGDDAFLVPSKEQKIHFLDTLLKYKPFNIHPTLEALETLRQTIQRNKKWLCTRPSMLSVDADGSLRICDDYKGFKNKIVELDFIDFLTDWKKVNLCEGCYWTTHVMSEQLLEEVRAGININDHTKRRQ